MQLNILHIIISTSGKKKFLTRVNQDILYNYITSVVYNKVCEPLAVGGYSNHVHILVKLSPDLSLGNFVKEVLQNTTDFLRRERSVFPEFSGWDSNFQAISCDPVFKEQRIDEIKTQFDYHRTATFEEELKKLFD